MIHSLVHDAGSHGTGSTIDGLLAYYGTAAAFERFDLGMAANREDVIFAGAEPVSKLDAAWTNGPE